MKKLKKIFEILMYAYFSIMVITVTALVVYGLITW